VTRSFGQIKLFKRRAASLCFLYTTQTNVDRLIHTSVNDLVAQMGFFLFSFSIIGIKKKKKKTDIKHNIPNELDNLKEK
jgi:hypothetical protein